MNVTPINPLNLNFPVCTARFNIQQDRQYTHNVTLRRVRATIVAMEKQYLLHVLSVCL
jgi:hypothetical protein